MKSKFRLALAIAAGAFVAGCSSGYPSTEDRVKSVDATIQQNSLPSSQSPTRDTRFTSETGNKPDAPPPGKK